MQILTKYLLRIFSVLIFYVLRFYFDIKKINLNQKLQMHNYNPPIKFSHRTRIGNWSEEWQLEEVKRKDYLINKNSNRTQGKQKQKQLINSYQSASLTYSKDGFYHFGDHIMLYNGKTNAFLATDIYNQLFKTSQHYELTTVSDIHACARSVFILERAKQNDGYKDDKIHYGQQFRIRINPLLIDKPLYLYSEPPSMTKYSKISRLQQVNFALNQSYNVNWVFQNPNPNVRFQSQNQLVRLDDNVLIKHQLTNKWLASDTKSYKNNYGLEFEVMAHNFIVNNKTQNLKQEKNGISTIDIPLRSQTTQNLWLIITAHDPAQQFDQKVIKYTYSKGPLLQKIKYALTDKGIFGIRFLSKVFKNMDLEKKHKLDHQDFRWGLHAAKIFLSQQQNNGLIKEFDDGNTGFVNYPKFMQELKGKISQKRLVLIENAYKTLKKILGEKTTLEQIAKVFDAQRHPEVYTKVKTPQQVFNQFVASWDNILPDYKISLPQFIDYFSDISAIIPKDDHFQFLMISIFHI